MTERPELPPARRRRTASMICRYLGVEPNEKRVNLLADVLLTGELDFALACHRHGEMSKSKSYYQWWIALAEGLKNKLASVAYLKESFSIYSEVSEAVIQDLVDDPQLALGDSHDVPATKENA